MKRLRRFVASVAVVSVAAFVLVGCEGASPPADAGYFDQRPAGEPLPLAQDCGAAVQRSSWEPRPENQQWNAASQVPNPTPTIPPWGGMTDTWNQRLVRVTGQTPGFDDDSTPPETDELIQFFACKWGLDDNWIRAQAVAESSWRQRFGGDWHPDTGSNCAANAPRRVVNGVTECAESLGLTQVRTRFRPAEISPWVFDSTSYHLDYYAWEFRGCLEGQKFVGNPNNPQGLSAANDLPNCIANWFSGCWPMSCNGTNYYNTVKSHHDNRTWLQSGF